MMHNKVHAKNTDPGSFIIPCSIGNNYSCKALCGPGASIDLMPKSVFQKLSIGEAKPTTIMLQLADRCLPELTSIGQENSTPTTEQEKTRLSMYEEG
ncbi:hypothetical protein V6N13_110627 [Hibiscus sabdariffa]